MCAMRRPWRGRRDGEGDGDAGRAPRATRGVYGLAAFLATAIDVIVGIVALIILIGIALVVFDADAGNAIVGAILDAGEFLVGPFGDVFVLDDRKREVAFNWGLAIVVYVVVGRLVSGLLRRGSD